jgi:EpsI family protein
MIGALCLGAAGAAFALKPRRRISLLGSRKLAEITPQKVLEWSSRDVSDLSAPSTPDSLVQKLYGEVVQRVYHNDSTGDDIMLLLAHGDSQTNDLQVHRPEACYPAFGFEVSGDRRVDVPIGGDTLLPVRQLIAKATGTTENIVYWVRLGDMVPASGQEQRIDRVETAMHGVIADGLLARFSVDSERSAESMSLIERFIPAFLLAVDPGYRAAFIGPTRADAMQRMATRAAEWSRDCRSQSTVTGCPS